MFKTSLMLALSYAVVGCATPPQTHKLDLDRFGPIPGDHEATTKAYYARILENPSSAEYVKIAAPKPVWLAGIIEGSSYAYAVCVDLRAKDTRGKSADISEALIMKAGQVTMRLPFGELPTKKLC
jgi:hypothetical protein